MRQSLYDRLGRIWAQRTSALLLMAAISYLLVVMVYLGPWIPRSIAATTEGEQHLYHRPTTTTTNYTEAPTLLQQPTWTTLIKDSLNLYSAHWDVRALHDMQPPFVRILAYTANHTSIAENLARSFECKFYLRDASTVLVSGRIIRHPKTALSDNAFFILCPGDTVIQKYNHSDSIPMSVALLCEGCYSKGAYEIYGQRLLGQLAEPLKRDKLAMCVRPSFGPVTNTLQLIQFLVYYTSLGVKHFTFFNVNGMAPNFVKILQIAQREGISIEVLPWNDQHEDTKATMMHEHNQYMAITYCIYRFMPYFEYGAHLDLDEYISYRHGSVKALPDVLDDLLETNPNAAAFLFRHYLFTMGGDDKEVATPQADDTPPFDIFKYTIRHGPLEPHQRSKIVWISDRTVTSTIHNLGGAIQNYTETVVVADDAALFHFRKRAIFRVMDNGTEDLEMRKYIKSLSRLSLTSMLLADNTLVDYDG